MSTTPIPPPETLRMQTQVHRVPFGWDVVVRVRENPKDEQMATSPANALMLAWAELTNRLRKAGVNVEKALADVPGPESFE